MSKKRRISLGNSSIRLFWADCIRIIAIIFVVQIHVKIFPLALISVPLFVMLSGALLLNKQESTINFVRRRVLNAVVPWFAWTLIYTLYYLFILQNHPFPVGVIDWSRYIIRMLLTALWFFPLIISLYILTPFYRAIITHVGNIEKYALVLVWFLFFSVLPYLLNSASFPKYQPNIVYFAFQFSGYFLLGSMLISVNPTKKILTLFVLSFVCSLFFMTKESWGFLQPAVAIGSVCAFYLIYILFSKAEIYTNSKVKKAISVFSSACLGVYVVHGLLLSIEAGYYRQILTQWRLDFLTTFIVFFISIIVVLLLKRIPVIRYIVP